MSILKKILLRFVNLFRKNKKTVDLPQGKEYETWLGV